MNNILVIDPYVRNPAQECFNHLVHSFSEIHFSYLAPHQTKNGFRLLAENTSDAYIILGSASHVHEKLSWHKELAEEIEKKLRANKPVLGLCFGHQLMAAHYGCKIDYWGSPEDKKTQWRQIKFIRDWGGFRKEEILTLAVSHRQIITELSSEFEEIARGIPSMPFDIIKHKTLPFLGTQAHPEASQFFCHDEAELTIPDKITSVQQDGLRFISRFIEMN